MSGTAAPSFVASLLEEYISGTVITADHEEDIKGAAGVIYAGVYFLRSTGHHSLIDRSQLVPIRSVYHNNFASILLPSTRDHRP